MRIAKEGYPVIAAPALLTLACAFMGWTWAAVVFAVVTFAVAAFFRDPDRKPPAGEGLILAPADGRIVEIRDIDEFTAGARTRLSIFMSPLDVHVNRSPMTGVVGYQKYIKGEFLVAHDSEAVHRNERALIGLESGGHKLLFAQVAGYIARRIVCPVRVGDTLRAGERFGMIKFGSRVDIYLPKDARILTRVGDVVRAGETVLAEFP